MFQIIQDIRKPTPDTIKDLADAGYQTHCLISTGTDTPVKNMMKEVNEESFLENYGKNCEFIDFKKEDLFSPERKFTKACERPNNQKTLSQEFIYETYKDPVNSLQTTYRVSI